MATTLGHVNNHMTFEINRAKSKLWAVPIGRTLFSLIFLFASIGHFSSGTIGYAQSQGVPMPSLLVPLSGLMAFLGGLSILLGYHARVGATLIILFLVPVTFYMHNFWAVTDPQMHQMQMVHFLKNLSMLGGAILILFYGSGPYSVDSVRRKYL